MEFIFGFLLFSIACYVSFYLPGKLILSRIFSQLSSPTSSILAWPVGISLFVVGSYITAWAQLPYLYLGVIAAVLLFGLVKDRELLAIPWRGFDAVSLGIILLGSVTFLSLTAFSFLQTSSGIQFIGTINVIDGLLHIAYTKNLLATFPPHHAGLSSISLRGYHYFYDLLISHMVMFYHFSPQDLYYRYMSLFVSLSYGCGFYALSKKLTDNKLSQYFVLFFAYFAQSLAFLLSFFIPSIGPVSELGSIYPLELILNPAIILSIGMMLYFICLLFETKPKAGQLMIVGFLFGSIVELKVYTGIIGICVLGIVLLIRFLKDKKNILFYSLSLVTTCIVALVTYVPNNLGAGSLWYSPFFAYSVFMQEPPFTSWNWETARLIFVQHHNIPRLILSYAEAIGLFWLLSLGSRVVFLLGLQNVFKRSLWVREENIAIMVMISVSILIGSLFVQSVSIFDTKQFFWIAGCLIAIPSGIALGASITKVVLPLKLLVIGGIIFLSVGGVYGQMKNFIFSPTIHRISNADVKLLANIVQNLPKKSSIIYLPTIGASTSIAPFTSAPVIAALTGHETYYEPESAQFDLGSIYNDRKQHVQSLQKAVDICDKGQIKQLMQDMKSDYVITTKHESCLENMALIKKENKDGLSFYKVL